MADVRAADEHSVQAGRRRWPRRPLLVAATLSVAAVLGTALVLVTVTPLDLPRFGMAGLRTSSRRTAR